MYLLVYPKRAARNSVVGKILPFQEDLPPTPGSASLTSPPCPVHIWQGRFLMELEFLRFGGFPTVFWK